MKLRTQYSTTRLLFYISLDFYYSSSSSLLISSFSKPTFPRLSVLLFSSANDFIISTASSNVFPKQKTEIIVSEIAAIESPLVFLSHLDRSCPLGSFFSRNVFLALSSRFPILCTRSNLLGLPTIRLSKSSG